MLSGYLLAFTGTVVLTALAGIILPEGKTAKTVRAILALFAALTLLAPLSRINLDDITASSSAYYSYAPDTETLYAINYTQKRRAEASAEKALSEIGYAPISLEIAYYTDGGVFIVKKVTVKIEQAVISSTTSHINITKEITSALEKLFYDGVETVVYYE